MKRFAFLFARYGYGAEHILSMRAVLADGRIVKVTPEKTKVRNTKEEIFLSDPRGGQICN